MSSQTAQNVGGLEKITKITLVLNGKQVDVPLPEGTDRYFRLRRIERVPNSYQFCLTVYRGPHEQNGHKTFGKETQPVENGELYRIADDATQLHFSKQDE